MVKLTAMLSVADHLRERLQQTIGVPPLDPRDFGLAD